MRLTHIKLAGFKSFVEPTTLALASNLTSVVGPNGCGKSNVIDAVRWVTGESNARQLRGEALEDVIFNGSNARKPVGRASVELRFDNSDDTLGGQYASFNEISVRRELTRDGASKYTINGTRARRRDVVDLFLGTGLGGRSNYAVIEQGAVNRLVEAKPEEMRQVLEEAAGISKYKERRRETENRIRHTRENLDRLNDLIGEVSQRLTALKRQAADAEKYKSLKADERRLRSELLALKWQARHDEVVAAETTQTEVENRLRSVISERRAALSEQESATAAQHSAHQALQQYQAGYYDAQAEVGRIEQARKHARELAELRARERQSLVDRLEALAARRDDDQRADASLAETEARDRQALAEAEAETRDKRAERERAEQAANDAENAWDALNNQAENPVQQLEAEKTRARYATAERDKLATRLARRRDEYAQLPETDEERLAARQTHIAELVARQEADEQQGEAEDGEAQRLQAAIVEHENELETVRARHAECQAELSAERTLQRAVLREDDERIAAWFADQAQGEPRGVARDVQIDPAWQEAARGALGALLAGFVVDALMAAEAPSPSWPEERLTLVLADAPCRSLPAAAAPAGLPCLADGLTGPAPLMTAAAHVFVAPDWPSARAAQHELAAHQRIVTLDGACLGPGHLQTPIREPDEGSVHEREQRIAECARTLAQLAAARQDIQTRLEVDRETARGLAETIDARESDQRHRQREIETARAELEGERLRAEQIRTRRQELETEQTELTEQLAEVERTAEAAGARVNALAADARDHVENREATRARLDEARRVRDRARGEAGRAERARAELETRLGQQATRRENLAARLAETLNAYEDMQARITRFDAEAGPAVDESNEASADLEAARERLATAERELRSAREALAGREQALDSARQSVMTADQRLEQARDALSQARVEVETAATRRQGVVEQLAELGAAPANIVDHLEAGATIEAWQGEIERLENRISRLGAINLAAIEEYQDAAERERYLAEQHADLSEALDTLEAAIARIDRETRQRFKRTYEQIDQRFSQMFPQLFGGGEAALSLTEEDWLTTGVRVMARPPGKRNASIQMLSGGEKALTAVALLFALFELNPAPFCMLDEIDAPLDDANVARFCELVRTMSARVQFIIITHNKLTMELAEQLHGVTMAEPGVSRLVSVDIDAALDLAG